MATARGPLNALLSSSNAQWATVLGTGAYIAYPDKIMETVRNVLGDTTTSRAMDTANSRRSSSNNSGPMIIHVNGGNDGSRGGGNSGGSVWGTIVTYTLGAGCVWISYTVLSNVLPNYIGNFLPVTRKVFQKATDNLYTSVCNVKDVLGNQILLLMKNQDDMSQKQDDTLRDVKDIQDDMKFVRADLSAVGESIDRCEASIESSQRLNSYTARGVKLLVAAVGSVLPRDNHQILRELQDYARDGEHFRRQLESSLSTPRSKNNNNSTAPPQQTIVPPENEHPTSLSRQNTSSTLENNNNNISALQYENFMSMIRDGTVGSLQASN